MTPFQFGYGSYPWSGSVLVFDPDVSLGKRCLSVSEQFETCLRGRHGSGVGS